MVTVLMCRIFRVVSLSAIRWRRLKTNIREVITGHIAVMKEFGEPIPQPTTLAEYVEIPVAVGQ